MRTFEINDHIKIEARTYETRYSWGHKAILYIDGEYIKEYKLVYYNRTWEKWQFASMLSHIASSKQVNKDQKNAIDAYLERN